MMRSDFFQKNYFIQLRFFATVSSFQTFSDARFTPGINLLRNILPHMRHIEIFIIKNLEALGCHFVAKFLCQKLEENGLSLPWMYLGKVILTLFSVKLGYFSQLSSYAAHCLL